MPPIRADFPTGRFLSIDGHRPLLRRGLGDAVAEPELAVLAAAEGPAAEAVPRDGDLGGKKKKLTQYTKW